MLDLFSCCWLKQAWMTWWADYGWSFTSLSFYTYALDERQPSPPVSEGLADHLVQMGCPISSPTSVVRGKMDQACWMSMGDMGNVKNCELSSPWHIFVLHFIVSEPLSQWNENIGMDWLMQLHQNFVPICAEKTGVHSLYQICIICSTPQLHGASQVNPRG